MVLCLHTLRADCNTSPARRDWCSKWLCLHTLRADCNVSLAWSSRSRFPLPPHAPCRLQRIWVENFVWSGYFASTRSVQIATKLPFRASRRRLLCLHTLRADCNGKRRYRSAQPLPLPPHAPCRLQRMRARWTSCLPKPLPPHAPCRLQQQSIQRVRRCNALPPHAPCRLQRVSPFESRSASTLPPHAPCRLQRQKCTELQYTLFRTCVELVDSFSVLNKSMLR